MHVLRVLQQLFFQQAFQHGVAALADAGRQVHGVPRKHLPRYYGHHLAAAVRQLWGRGLATARHTQAIGADHKLESGVWMGGQVDDQHGGSIVERHPGSPSNGRTSRQTVLVSTPSRTTKARCSTLTSFCRNWPTTSK